MITIGSLVVLNLKSCLIIFIIFKLRFSLKVITFNLSKLLYFIDPEFNMINLVKKLIVIF